MEKYDTVRKDYGVAVATAHEQKMLIEQLEKDLLSVQALSSMFRGEGEGEPSSTALPAEILQKSALMAPQVKSATVAPSSADAEFSGSLLPIVTSQRERYRVRNQELEATNQQQQQTLGMLQNEMDRVRSDNVKLYEKIKFLQSYPSRTTAAVASEDVESRYSAHYEEKLNPFSRFNRKEKQRKYANLTIYDKASLYMGRFILGSKIARTITFFYTIMLHMLVFMVLYKLVHTESCRRDLSSDWQHKYDEHMASAHGAPHAP